MHIIEVKFGNTKCICLGKLRSRTPPKGYKMYECDMIEMEDFSFNHFIHHYDDCDCEQMHFNEEFDCIEILAECCEEIIWE